MKNIITTDSITKLYKHRDGLIHALNNVSFSINKGDFTTITGPSGSGKTTLLLALSGLIKISSGSIKFENKELFNLNDNDLAEYRKKHVGFVMQNFSLVPYLTAIQNVMIPLGLNKIESSKQKNLATAVLEMVGLGNRANHFPRELSAGQQQRVAIARALVNKPDIIFADEPTGNLDQETEEEILKLFKKVNQEMKKTFIIVTHEPSMLQHSNRIYKVEGGKVFEIHS